MKKGRHCLHLQANEEDVYRLMDTKERYFWMIGIGSLLEGIAAYFLYFRIKCWDLLYLCVILAFGIILLLRQAVKISRKIMEAEVCYMELDVYSLAVCQPEKNGHYECCRIFYNEIDKIVEGTLRGVPEFYIVLNDQKEKESFFLLDEEEQNRNIFRVRSFGFDHQKFIEFYRKLRWNVPGRVRIIGTKNQDVWNLRKPNMEICIMVGMIACYVIPKLLEVMKLF